VLFEARKRPRWLLGGAMAALAFGLVVFAAAGGPVFLWFGAVTPAWFAIREWTIYPLRITEDAIEHLPPHWAASATAGFVSALLLTARVDAKEVAGLEWDGHDSIGIRMPDGRVDVVAIRDRIAAGDQSAARAAVLSFVARASGTPLPLPPLDVATWVVGKRARPSG
jgi:hypothetical protein